MCLLCIVLCVCICKRWLGFGVVGLLQLLFTLCLRQSFAEPEIDLTNLTRQAGSKSQIPSVSASPSTHSTSADCMVWFSYGCQIPAQVFMSVRQSLHSPSHLLSHCFHPSLCLSSPPPLLHPLFFILLLPSSFFCSSVIFCSPCF